MILNGRLQAILAAYLFGALLVSAQTLQIDFNHGSATQSGWDSIAAGDTDLGDSWSKTFSGSIGLDVDAIGSVGLDTRDRGSNNGGGAEASMWRDFLFANGSFIGNQGSGLSLAFTGLQPNTEYPITIWAFDESSNDDLDGDGLAALLEHAFGSINGDAGASPESQVVIGTGLLNGGTEENLTIPFRRNLAADDVIITAEISSDLASWNSLGVQYVSSIPNGDGTETVTYRSTAPFASIDKEFVRIRVTQRP